MKSPLVSIISPNRNGAVYLEETIKSIRNQNYKNIEYIIIDGLSDDNSIEIIKANLDIVAHYLSEKDDGMYNAINKGMRLAKGEIVAYLNSDDKYFPETISTIVNFFEKNPDVDLSYGNLDYINEDGKKLFTKKFPNYNRKRFISSNYSLIGQPATFWRRSLFDKIGYFDDSMRMAGDFDFFCKAGKVGKLRHINITLASFRVHSESLSSLQVERNKMEVNRIHESYKNELLHQSKLSLFINDLNFKILNWRSFIARIFN